jgi:hypothetical protein
VKQSCPVQQPAVIAADFLALYNRCLASGLKARLNFSHSAGHQVLTVSCNLPEPAVNLAAAGKRRRRHRRRQRRARAAIASARVSTPPTATPAAPTPAAPSPAVGPCPLSPETAPPPVKRTRKRRNELELLRDWDEDTSSSSPLYLAAARRHLPRHPLPIPAISLRRHPTHRRRRHVIHCHATRQPSNLHLHYWNSQHHLYYWTRHQSLPRHCCQNRLRTWSHP